MSSYSRISKAFQHPCRLPLYQDSRYVLFSDCHRGTGRSNDNFLKNEFLYVSALKYYEEQGYTYLELGDGDELWENRSFCAVKSIHPDSFELLGRFFRQDRFYAVYGNHDIIKRKKNSARHTARIISASAINAAGLCFLVFVSIPALSWRIRNIRWIFISPTGIRPTFSTVFYGRSPVSSYVISGALWNSWAFLIPPVPPKTTGRKRAQKNAWPDGPHSSIIC